MSTLLRKLALEPYRDIKINRRSPPGVLVLSFLPSRRGEGCGFRVCTVGQLPVVQLCPRDRPWLFRFWGTRGDVMTHWLTVNLVVRHSTKDKPGKGLVGLLLSNDNGSFDGCLCRRITKAQSLIIRISYVLGL